MYKAYKPTQFTKPPEQHHSVYGVGQWKPKLIGIKDINRGLRENNFLPNEITICSPDALFFNTGKFGPNGDLLENSSGNE